MWSSVIEANETNGSGLQDPNLKVTNAAIDALSSFASRLRDRFGLGVKRFVQ